MVLSGVMCTALLAGCGTTAQVETPVAEATEQPAAETAEQPAEEPAAEQTDEVSDQDAADEVADLIDEIYVQERTETTDEDCAKAKAAWDALTDAQKELVEGVDADPDYFGRDTGDASKDDPLNADDIGETELLVVSFGTSFNDSRAEDIGGIEKAIAEAYPELDVRRAFSAQIIINHVQARDDEHIDNVEQALDRAVANGVKNLIIQPTHLMHGAEYDEIIDAVEEYSDEFESIKVSEPMLGQVGEEENTTNADKEIVAKAVVEEAVAGAGFESAADAADKGTAFVLMGHGTSHSAKVTYSQMQAQMEALGYENVYIGTVEGEPETTACENVIDRVHEAGYTNVVLRPLMVVAGDHANNDMAGDEEDSWKSMFKASGYFENVDAQIEGLGRIKAIQQIYIEHIKNAQPLLGEAEASASLEDGVYEAAFETDSSMFHINEACNGKCTLTVADGKMSAHLVMPSKNVVSLYLGLADDAQKDGAALIDPVAENVTYSDGTTEEVFAFDVEIPDVNEEFDLALIGTKGKWYDHKVKVVLEEKKTLS